MVAHTRRPVLYCNRSVASDADSLPEELTWKLEEDFGGSTQGGFTRRMGGGSQEAPGERKGVYAPARPVESRASRASLGARGEGLHLRGPEWEGVPGRHV